MRHGWHNFGDANECGTHLARAVEEEVNADLKTLKRVSVVVPGGNTPKHFLAALSQSEIDWSRVDLTLSDERWVAPADHRSNERMVRGKFLSQVEKPPRFFSLWRSEIVGDSAQSMLEQSLGEMASPVSVAVVGIGADGHFGSLFPGEKYRDRQTKKCIWVPSKTRGNRISLSYGFLLSARKVYVLAGGKDKQKVLSEAQTTRIDLPISSFYWDRPNQFEVYTF
ncbi:MAG: 6-phosphogluconolactonase [Myxococcota bacterium]|nr:6-phosphogluconolactonase [Myxococcota bacterium]